MVNGVTKSELAEQFLTFKEQGNVDAAMKLCSSSILVITDVHGDLFGKDAVADYVLGGKGKKVTYRSGFEMDEKKRVLRVNVTETKLKLLKKSKMYEFHFSKSEKIRAIIVHYV